MNGIKLEVLEICNQNDEFEARLVTKSDAEVIEAKVPLLHLSASAQKLVVKVSELRTTRLILEEPYNIYVDLTRPAHARIIRAVFTADESQIIGRMYYGIPIDRMSVGVWTIKQQNGRYCENADMLHLFHSHDFSYQFTYFPETIQRNEGVILVNTAGEVIQRDLSSGSLDLVDETGETPQSVLTGRVEVDHKIIKQGSCIRFDGMHE